MQARSQASLMKLSALPNPVLVTETAVVIDDDSMATASATTVPTSESVVAYVTNLGVGGPPTGSVHAVAYDASAAVPTGYLYCGGAAVSRTTYADLFALIGTTHGTGDGSTTFNLPDYRGRFLRGLDDGVGLDTGRAIGSEQANSNKSHSHTATATGYTHNHPITVNFDAHSHNFFADPGTNAGTSGGSYIGNTRLGDSSGLVSYSSSVQADSHNHTASMLDDTHSHTLTVNSDGGTESRPENTSVTYIIKT